MVERHNWEVKSIEKMSGKPHINYLSDIFGYIIDYTVFLLLT